MTTTSTTEGIWNYSNNTAMADPGSGKFRANNTTPSTTTALALSKFGTQGTDLTYLLANIQVGDILSIQDRSNSANYVRHKVTALPTNNTSWFQIPVSMIVGGGTIPSNNTDCIIAFDAVAPQAVTSVFGRTGTVTAQAGDYSAFYPLVARQISTSPSLTGGGDLSADRTLTLLGDVTTPVNGQFYGYSGGVRGWFTPAPTGTVNPGTWTNLTYSTGWSQNTTAQYRVEVNGSFSQVISQGIINYASGAAALAFTLPAGAQPGVKRGCVLNGFDSTGDVLLFSANIATSGAVTIYPMVRQNFAWPSATNGSVYLEGLCFSL